MDSPSTNQPEPEGPESLQEHVEAAQAEARLDNSEQLHANLPSYDREQRDLLKHEQEIVNVNALFKFRRFY